MAIPLHGLTSVARQADITRYYPGGLPACHATYPPLEDPGLAALCPRCGGDLKPTRAALAAHGLAVGRPVASGDSPASIASGSRPGRRPTMRVRMTDPPTRH